MVQRFQHLDGLRGLAAVTVMVAHGVIAFDFALYSGDPSNSVTNWDVWLSGAPFMLPVAASLAVCLFFALSGFVLIGSFDAAPQGFVPLLVKRYVRLAIPVICACVLSWVIIVAGWMANHQVAAITRSSWLDTHFGQSPSLIAALEEGATVFFASTGMLQSYDAPLWTMPIEFAGSVGILLACFVTKSITAEPTRRRLIYIVFGLVLYVVLIQSYLGLFAAGALIRQTMPHGWRWLSSHPAITLMLCVIGLFLGTAPVSKAAWPLYELLPVVDAPSWLPWAASGAMFWHAIGAVLVLIGLQSSRLIQRGLATPLFRWLGDISFPLYLVHLPILMSLGCWIFWAGVTIGAPRGISAIIAILIFGSVAVACAHVFMLLIERRVIRWSGSLARRVQRFTQVSPIAPKAASSPNVTVPAAPHSVDR